MDIKTNLSPKNDIQFRFHSEPLIKHQKTALIVMALVGVFFLGLGLNALNSSFHSPSLFPNMGTLSHSAIYSLISSGGALLASTGILLGCAFWKYQAFKKEASDLVNQIENSDVKNYFNSSYSLQWEDEKWKSGQPVIVIFHTDKNQKIAEICATPESMGTIVYSLEQRALEAPCCQ